MSLQSANPVCGSARTKLTFYIQMHCVALAVALFVAADARIRTASGPCHVLQHQALIRHDNASRHVIVQKASLCVRVLCALHGVWRGQGEKESMHACMHVTMLDYTLWGMFGIRLPLLSNHIVHPHMPTHARAQDLYGSHVPCAVRF